MAERRIRDRRVGVAHESRWVRMREWCRGRNPAWRIPLVIWAAIATLQFAFNAVDITGIALIATTIHSIGHAIFSFAGHPFDTTAGPLLLFALPFVIYRIAERTGSDFWRTMMIVVASLFFIWFLRFMIYPDGPIYMSYEERAAEAGQVEIIRTTLAAAGIESVEIYTLRGFGFFIIACMLWILVSQMRYMLTLPERRRRVRRRF